MLSTRRAPVISSNILSYCGGLAISALTKAGDLDHFGTNFTFWAA